MLRIRMWFSGYLAQLFRCPPSKLAVAWRWSFEPAASIGPVRKAEQGKIGRLLRIPARRKGELLSSLGIPYRAKDGAIVSRHGPLGTITFGAYIFGACIRTLTFHEHEVPGHC